MVRDTLKILRCEHRKIFKVCFAVLQHYAWKGYPTVISGGLDTSNLLILKKINIEMCINECSNLHWKEVKNIYSYKPSLTLREKCPNTELFLVHIFLYLNWIRVFELNTEIYSVDLRIQFKYRKIWSRKNPVFRQFSRIVKIICRTIFFVFTDPDRYIANRNSFFITNRGKCHYRSGQNYYILGQVLQIGANLLKIGGNYYKSVA